MRLKCCTTLVLLNSQPMFRLRVLLLWLCITFCEGRITMNGTHEKALRDELFKSQHYDKQMRPVLHPSLPLNVTFNMHLSKLTDLSTKNQILQTDVWIIQKWMNPYLAWNKSDYGGIHSLHIMPVDIWVPDTVLYNSGEGIVLSGSVEKFKTNVVLDSSGMCTWMSPATFKSSCQIDVTFFPFDTQTCKMTFGSWTYDNRLLKLELMDKTHSNAGHFTMNGDWRIEKIAIKPKDTKYPCCPYPYSDITYTFVMERIPLYHVIYVVLPCVIIALLTLVCFYVPADCGERIGLCITILLAMSVYLLLVANSLPENSNTVPLLGIYYMATMCQVAAAIVATAVVLRCHYSQSKPPKILVRFAHYSFRNKMNGAASRVKETPKQGRVSPETEMTEFGDVSPKINGSHQKTSEDHRDEEMEDREQWAKEWLLISKRLDNVFFFIFLLMFFITPLAIFLQRAPIPVIDD